MVSKLEKALELAVAGYYVFPLIDNGKIPDNNLPWKKVSTRNADTINRWWKCPITGWEQGHNIGIDCGKSGLVVIDVDTKEGKDGAKSFARLEIENEDFPDTAEVITQSGGRHLYFEGDGYANTQGDRGGIAPGIDTRATGGYVVAPGSEIDGKFYTWKRETKPRPLPEWILPILSAHKVKEKDTSSAIENMDEPEALERAIDWLKNHDDGAVEGAGGDHHTVMLAMKLRDFGVSSATALDLMLEHWNEKCSPPWDAEDLEKKIRNAYNYAKNAAGIQSAAAEFDTTKPVTTTINGHKLPFINSTTTPAAHEIPSRDWVFGNLALARKLSVIGAPGGTGKSTLALIMALSKATGRNLLGIDPHGAAPVMVWNQEDDMEELQRRLAAIMQHFRIPREELERDGKPMLWLGSGENRPLRIAKKVGVNGAFKPEDVEPLIATAKEFGARFIIIDPFAETHPANENSNEEIIQVGMMYRHVAQSTNSALMLIHHSRKPENADSRGHDGEMETLRGASALSGIARIIATFFTMNRKDAKTYGIPEETRGRYVKLAMAKANMSAPGKGDAWFERIGERISCTIDNPDGEEIGVLRSVKLTPKNEDVDSATQTLIVDIEALIEDMGDEGVPVREIAESLCANFPMHQGKQPESLSRAIRRIFEVDGSRVAGAIGMLYMVERVAEGKKKTLQYIRWTPHSVF